MKKILVLMCLTLIFPLSADETTKKNDFLIGFSYFGELISHPGASLDFGYKVIDSGKYELIPTVSATAYYHKRNHGAFLFEAGVLQRLNFSPVISLDLNLGAGFMAVRPDGLVYVYDSENQIVENSSPWRLKLALSSGLGLGISLDSALGVPLDLHVDLGAFFEYPYNSAFLPHLFVSGGVRYWF